MKKNKKLLVIGAGSIGKRQISNFTKYFIIDIAEVRSDRISETVKKFEINKIFKDYKKALKSEKYDAVAITVPPHLHLPIAKLATKHNAGLFIEKPLGMSSKGWKEVHKICSKKGLINYVAYCHRFAPYTVRLKKLINQKTVGRIYSSHLKWSSYLPDWHKHENYKNFYMSKKEQGGGSLLDDSHGIDLIRHIIGDVESVNALVTNISELKMTSDDSFFATLKMKNKSIAQISFDLFSRTPRIYLEITGSKGTIIWNRVDHTIKIYNRKKNNWKIEKYNINDLMSMYPNQAKYFYECILKKRKNFNNIIDALNTQKVIDAGFLSNKKKKIVKI
ncbi:Gfo/Idh/MocA family oxidoreductase [Candidatus Pelagibacter sp.]|nr:Gfo/Idh/MocA family oxidoreductase [Candidatus Pelagibacter sp.]